jgi:hypothetical protein
MDAAFSKKIPCYKLVKQAFKDRDRSWAEAALKLRKREVSRYFLASKQLEGTFASSSVTAIWYKQLAVLRYCFWLKYRRLNLN